MDYNKYYGQAQSSLYAELEFSSSLGFDDWEHTNESLSEEQPVIKVGLLN